MRGVLVAAVSFMLGAIFVALAANEPPGTIGIWQSGGVLGYRGNATAPRDFGVTGNLFANGYLMLSSPGYDWIYRNNANRNLGLCSWDNSCGNLANFWVRADEMSTTGNLTASGRLAANNAPLYLYGPSGTAALIRSTYENWGSPYTWQFGTGGSTAFVIADVNAGAIRLNINPQGVVEICSFGGPCQVNINNTPAVSCGGPPSGNFRVTAGIVTQC